MKDIDEVLNSIGADEPTQTSAEVAAAENAGDESGAGDSQETGGQEKPENEEVQTVTVAQVVPGSEIPGETVTEEKTGEEKPAETKPAELNPGEVKPSEEKDGGEKAPTDDKLKEHADALEKELPGGAHVKEATRKDWDALKTAGKEFKSKYEETQTKLQSLEAEKVELEKKVSEGSKELPAPVAKEIEYLRERVAELDANSLPEVKTNYDDKITEVEAGIIGFFDAASKNSNYQTDEIGDDGEPTGRKIGLTAEVVGSLKAIVAEKGFLGYNWSGWINQCLESGAINSIEARGLENSIAHAMNLASHKKVAVEQFKTTWAARKQAADAEKTQQVEEHKQIVTQVATKTREEFNKRVTTKEWSKPPAELKAGATDAEKATHKTATEAFEAKSKLFPKLLKTFYGSQAIRFHGDETIPHITPDEFIGFIADAFDKKDVDAKVSGLQAKLDAANKELDEFRAGGSTAPKTSRGSDASPSASPNANLLNMSPQAILDSIG